MAVCITQVNKVPLKVLSDDVPSCLRVPSGSRRAPLHLACLRRSQESLHPDVSVGFHSYLTHVHVQISTTPGGFVAANEVVIHSTLAEITDNINQELAVSIYSLPWPVGGVIGLVSLLFRDWATSASYD